MKRILTAATAALMLINAQHAAAQVFKCTVNGRQVYQSKPCKAGDKPVDINAPAPADGPKYRATNNHREYLQHRAEKQRRAESIVDQRARQARNNRLARERAEAEKQRLESAAFNGRVVAGMSRKQVLSAWGKPEDIRTYSSSNGESQRWAYKDGYDWNFVYIRNGVVTSVSRN